MKSPARRDRGDWVSLIDGVRVSRHWMTRHTPRLLAAWRDARTLERRRAVAVRILQVAAELESEPDGFDIDDTLADQPWRTVAERIDARLVCGPDWLPLAAALARAAAAGYDVVARLATLAAAAPLPERQPARELHWRLLDDCPAALPVLNAVQRPAGANGLPDRDSAAPYPQICRDIPRAACGDAASNRSHPPCEGDQS
ncbi:hypothetical protein [Blastococcus litoris]|uniref:hypothetical protein n=1 Tax=Blastococcus litoris TaxID=2171622 RepID=UPI000E308842|nr:hypothetical protein [Blastococcus litoris]